MIATFVLQHPTLRQTLARLPSVTVSWEESETTENGELLVLFWAEADDFDAFERAMREDPSVTAPRCLTEFGDRRLYQVEEIGEARARQVHPALVEAGGVVRECTGTSEGWRLEVAFPDIDALQYFHDVCREYDLDFRLLQKYEQAEGPEATPDFGLTEKQRQALALAARMDYFEVPRGSSLTEISEELGISHQAASERVRRAIDVLVDHAIGPAVDLESDPDPDDAPRRSPESGDR